MPLVLGINPLPPKIIYFTLSYKITFFKQGTYNRHLIFISLNLFTKNLTRKKKLPKLQYKKLQLMKY